MVSLSRWSRLRSRRQATSSSRRTRAGLTGGDEGFSSNFDPLPDFLVGVVNTKNLYWVALVYAAAVFLIARIAIGSSAGHVWHAIRDNERRVEVIGLRPYPYKLISFVLASFLARLGRIRLALADRSDSRGDVPDVHADASRDGRSRRRRDALRARWSAGSLHAARLPARAISRVRSGSRTCRTSFASRCPNRSSFWGALHRGRVLRARWARQPSEDGSARLGARRRADAEESAA